MGKFNGHFYPGLYLYSYGLYQTIVISKAIIFNESTLHSPCPPKNKRKWAILWKISYSGVLKMVTGSLLTAYVVICLDDGMVLMNKQVPSRFMYPKEWQHLTMFILLTLNGCVDILSKNLLPQRCVFLELGVQVLTFCVLLLLLVSHIQGSEGVELQVHSLLILVVLLLVLVLTVELWTPGMFHLWIMETFLFLSMGSWLMQAAFILYKPITGYPWQDEDLSDLAFVTTFFCWHVMINASCQLGIYSFSFLWYNCFCFSWKSTEYKEAPYHRPYYKLLHEVEQSEKDDQAPLLPINSP
ncbi:PREDICTED: transmembrane epididymal protein 1-like [Elephantulus edwardii]|uniref:transmembrane epididymal protein 1-like n=1 Tax=Elephantulus edwardii TaxID=28737 RepID=UPI0003F0948F|nr:PREDICTED: transmembrane epididymal protein 1-like [Elephantulus edwardii]